MEILFPGEVIDRGPESAGLRFMLLVLLVWRSYSPDRRIWPTTLMIAQACCCGRDTAARRLRQLEHEGWISTAMSRPTAGSPMRREICVNTNRFLEVKKESQP